MECCRCDLRCCTTDSSALEPFYADLGQIGLRDALVETCVGCAIGLFAVWEKACERVGCCRAALETLLIVAGLALLFVGPHAMGGDALLRLQALERLLTQGDPAGDVAYSLVGPLKLGDRFSRNAARPSCASGPPNP